MTDGLLLRGARGRTALQACVIGFTAAGGGMPTPAKRTQALILPRVALKVDWLKAGGVNPGY
jgi:hypothetical protein